MTRLRILLFRLWAVVRSRRMDRELDDEIASHLAEATEEYIQRGLSPEDARRAALRSFGGVPQSKEVYRQVRSFMWLDDLRQDLRYALRTLRRAPAFTAVALLTLALGIGANTAIFSLMDSVMVRSLPVERPDELVMLSMQRPGAPPRRAFPNPLWEAIRAQQDVFSGVFAWSTPQSFDFAQGGVVRQIDGSMVSGDYFRTLGIRPALGRLIAETDDTRGCPPVVVLSHGFWHSQFGEAPAVLERTLTLNRQTFHVIGVTAARFHGVEVGRKFDVAIPVCAGALFDKRNVESPGRFWLGVMARVKPGLTPEQLRSRLDVLFQGILMAGGENLVAMRRQTWVQTRLVAEPAAAGPSALRRTLGEPLKLLMGAVAIVLLMACANVAALLVARATSRTQEMASRAAVGASRGRLVRQLLTESMVLSAMGATLGLLFSDWAMRSLLQSLTTAQTSVFVDASLNGRVLGFTAGVTFLTGIFVGLMPALRSTAATSVAAMRSHSPVAPARFQVGKWLVAAQVALSLVVLTGGGLLLHTFTKLLTLDPGFDRENVLLLATSAPSFAADTVKMSSELREVAYKQMDDRLQAIAVVVAVSRAFVTPIGQNNWMQPIIPEDSTTDPPTGDDAIAYFNFVTPGYFATLRIPLLAGRDFDQRDTRGSVGVAIVNESLARKFFPGIAALGRVFRSGRPSTSIQIVGIVKDSKYGSLRDAPPPTAFLPAAQAPERGEAQEFVVRTSMPAATVIPTIQRALADLIGEMPLRIRTLSDQVNDTIAQERTLAGLGTLFGALALSLAMIGLYGVLHYLVTRRQTEFGVRLALGARPASILRLVMRDVVGILTVGLVGGLAAALATVRLLEGLLFDLSPRDPLTIATAVVLLSAMAVLAAYVPARRAMRLDPLIALRSE